VGYIKITNIQRGDGLWHIDWCLPSFIVQCSTLQINIIIKCTTISIHKKQQFKPQLHVIQVFGFDFDMGFSSTIIGGFVLMILVIVLVG
jgi:hypothetical protein